MKTDYEDLNSFDASVVITIVIGLSLIMAMGFSQLSFENQADLVKAVPIFDLHDQAQQQLAVIQLMFESSEIFLDRFYVAFTQVAVLPDDTFTTRGRVLGALIDLSASTTSGGCGQHFSEEHLVLPYSYAPPQTLNYLKYQLIN